ncbi:sensor histidine kinase [Pinirhizobacter sp.]|jgi:PAS domain S-box-containing protein|uniref:sensor histidine kinase n=1 Tax=Pinirhizobacter sp. TaxID=2950432 RepID=UPI002F3E2CED
MPDSRAPRPFPANRLQAIRNSGLLDRRGEEQFGHLTEHVRVAMDVPVAIISIVDEHRQVFAGHSGLPEPWASIGETPITHSFCQHVVDAAEPLVVSDANLHGLVRENLAIVDLGVIAYLGVPIHLPTGELVGALAAIDSLPREWTGKDLRFLTSLARVVDKAIGLGVSELKYRTLIEDMNEGFYAGEAIWSSDGHVEDFLFEEINPAFTRLTGLSSSVVLGQPWSTVMPTSLAPMLPVYERVLRTGQDEVVHHKSEVLGGRWFLIRVRKLDGSRFVGFFEDVTEKRRAEINQHLVNHEIGHRLKNSMAMVQAIATSTLRGLDPVRVSVFEQRLQSLSGAHDNLLERHWKAAKAHTMIATTLGNLGVDGRVHVSGPDMDLGPKAALNLSMLVHELATNALKHGSLSVPDGFVDIAWSVEEGTDDALVTMHWHEHGGPPVVAPTRRSFGSSLIKMGILGGGGTTVAYLPEGLEATFSASLSQLQIAEF